jgi:hypothetical protein
VPVASPPAEFETGVTETAAAAGDPAGQADGNENTGAFPIVPLAGGAAVLTAAGGWWLIAAKRAATRVPAQATWGIPHGGVRPPQ